MAHGTFKLQGMMRVVSECSSAVLMQLNRRQVLGKNMNVTKVRRLKRSRFRVELFRLKRGQERNTICSSHASYLSYSTESRWYTTQYYTHIEPPTKNIYVIQLAAPPRQKLEN